MRAWVSIDAEDWLWAKEYRWYFSDGYVRRKQNGRQPSLHREILGLEFGDPREGDHKDRKPLNNRRSNLRVCTHKQNAHNKGKQQGEWSSRHRGVSWRARERKWFAYARVDGVLISGGYHDDEEHAAEVAAALRAEHFTHATD